MCGHKPEADDTRKNQGCRQELLSIESRSRERPEQNSGVLQVGTHCVSPASLSLISEAEPAPEGHWSASAFGVPTDGANHLFRHEAASVRRCVCRSSCTIRHQQELVAGSQRQQPLRQEVLLCDGEQSLGRKFLRYAAQFPAGRAGKFLEHDLIQTPVSTLWDHAQTKT